MFLRIDERIRGLALVTFIALMAYCILEHLAKQNLDPKATTNLLMKEFAAIVFPAGYELIQLVLPAKYGLRKNINTLLKNAFNMALFVQRGFSWT